MSYRPTAYDYSEDPSFAVKTVLGFQYPAGTYSIAGTPLGPATDLGSLKATIAEFEADDADGSADPTEKALVTAGGLTCTRSADGSTLQLGVTAPQPFARAVALRELLAFLGY